MFQLRKKLPSYPPSMRLARLVLICLTLLVLDQAAVNKAHAGGRIINGKPVATADYAERWSAFVEVQATYSGRMSLCGGILIDERTVLTAAHCTYSPYGQALPASSFMIVLGRRDQTTDRGEMLSAQTIWRHPSYSRPQLSHDIAALRLDRTPATPFEPMPVTSAQDQAWWGAGYGMQHTAAAGPWIAGFGYTDSYSGLSPVLREAGVPIGSDQACASASAPGHGLQFKADAMICAGQPSTATQAGIDSCQGDSGGPLIMGDGAGNWRLVGITSWGRDCGGAYYGVYTRVGRYVEWLAPLRYTPLSTPLQPTFTPPAPASASPAPAPSTQPPANTAPAPTAVSDPPAQFIGPVVKPAPRVRPSRVQGLRLVRRSSSWAQVRWRASSDDGLVRHYLLWQKKPGKTWKIVQRTLRPNGRVRLDGRGLHLLRVQAVDDQGLRSAHSALLRVRKR